LIELLPMSMTAMEGEDILSRKAEFELELESEPGAVRPTTI